MAVSLGRHGIWALHGL